MLGWFWASGRAAAAGAQTVTIYSSLPLAGPVRTQAEDVARGERLALEEVGSRVGSVARRFVSLNDATTQPRRPGCSRAICGGTWDAGQTSVNARKASLDRSTIAHIGDFNSGATAGSRP